MFFWKIFPKSCFFQLVGGVRSEQSLQKARVFSRKLAQCSGGMGLTMPARPWSTMPAFLEHKGTPKLPTTICFQNFQIPALHQKVDIAAVGAKGSNRTFEELLQAIGGAFPEKAAASGQLICNCNQSGDPWSQMRLAISTTRVWSKDLAAARKYPCKMSKYALRGRTDSVPVHAQGRWPEIVEWVAQPRCAWPVISRILTCFVGVFAISHFEKAKC